ncbi:hypothetical protein RI103_15535 [Paraburkholderia sp. FT54]|uniref:hypothetical protein n=1 Tax=Paraburkholderia sp. FT54 TaxID=3074437 RepID=UPI00287774FD|nr:hypothetical protein [Paraburkholderia sp. FT54]WNC89087.1 hypothetical protein RI103_15535 [Paraburkholderia sp. FT54]
MVDDYFSCKTTTMAEIQITPVSIVENDIAPRRSSVDGAFVFVLALVVLFIRMHGRLTRGYLWAEDAPIFIKEGFELGARAIITPYAGYLHAVPRILVHVYTWFGSVVSTPHAFAWLTTSATVVSCAYLYVIASRYLPRAGAYLIGLSPVLIPHNGEAWLNITNLQWVLAPVLLAMIWDCAQRTDANRIVGRCVAIGLLSLTGPFSILLSPVAALGIVAHVKKSGKRLCTLPLLIVVACGLVQLVTLMTSPPNHQAAHTAREYLHFGWGGAFFHYFVLDFVLADRWINGLGKWMFYVSFALFAVVLACVATLPGKWRIACVMALALAVAFWMLGVVRSDAPELPVRWSGVSARYTFVPLILCMWTFVIAAAKCRIALARHAATLFLLLMLLNSALRFAIPWYPNEIVSAQDGVFLVHAPPGDVFRAEVKPARWSYALMDWPRQCLKLHRLCPK